MKLSCVAPPKMGRHNMPLFFLVAARYGGPDVKPILAE
jgi:hypothetical protein